MNPIINKIKFALLLCATFVGLASKAQESDIAVKSNVLYEPLSLNVGLEFRTGDNYTFNIDGGFNLWRYSQNKKFKHFFVQPEFRYWFAEPMHGHFIGLHAHYMQFNIGNIKVLSLNFAKDFRYQGWLAGGGITYGYSWALSDWWKLETALGLGYAYIDYDKFYCPECGDKIKDDHRNYWGVTKVGVSIVYIIK